ncbi:hypothetical protein HDU87_003006 [Geranomyces variabilis]|uniref:Uncharacterized protein n=1 Tax=Geranomyces variabilis TaxID=109894 RepID=A0AAD5TN35_9FUNG|nr:hypothetical protein HDU87_003006 [Geranomyces variabilis]
MAYYRPQPRPVAPPPHALHRLPYPYTDAVPPPPVAGAVAAAAAPPIHHVRGPPPFWDSRPGAWEDGRDYLLRDPRFPAGVLPPGQQQHLGRWPSQQQLDGAYTFPPRQPVVMSPYEPAGWAPPPPLLPPPPPPPPTAPASYFGKGRQLAQGVVPHGFEGGLDRNNAASGRLERNGTASVTIVIRDPQDKEAATPVIDLTEEGEIVEPLGPHSRALVRIRERRQSPTGVDFAHHNGGVKRKYPNGWDMPQPHPPPPPPPPLAGAGRIAINPKFYAQFQGQLGRTPEPRSMGGPPGMGPVVAADRSPPTTKSELAPTPRVSSASSPPASAASLKSPLVPQSPPPVVDPTQPIPFNSNTLRATELSSSRSTAFAVDQHPWKIRSTRKLVARPRPDSYSFTTTETMMMPMPSSSRPVVERDGKKERMIFADAWISPEEMRATYTSKTARRT